MADSSRSADGFAVADAIKICILLTMNSPSATVPSFDTVCIFFGPFLTRNCHTPPQVAMTPHICNKQQFDVSLCLCYCFYQRCAHVLPDDPPPFIHLVEYASSGAATAHKPLGTEQTHVVPVKPPLPL